MLLDAEGLKAEDETTAITPRRNSGTETQQPKRSSGKKKAAQKPGFDHFLNSVNHLTDRKDLAIDEVDTAINFLRSNKAITITVKKTELRELFNKSDFSGSTLLNQFMNDALDHTLETKKSKHAAEFGAIIDVHRLKPAVQVLTSGRVSRTTVRYEPPGSKRDGQAAGNSESEMDSAAGEGEQQPKLPTAKKRTYKPLHEKKPYQPYGGIPIVAGDSLPAESSEKDAAVEGEANKTNEE